jgi:hypothetical protein
MIWIRIFRTRKQAEAARAVLRQGGIETFIVEQDFEGVPIQRYGVPARFSLEVRSSKEYFRAAEFLAKKMKRE